MSFVIREPICRNKHELFIHKYRQTTVVNITKTFIINISGFLNRFL